MHHLFFAHNLQTQHYNGCDEGMMDGAIYWWALSGKLELMNETGNIYDFRKGKKHTLPP